ncbi:MAG: hypothetical protein WB821_05675, partial [Burkholderiaceae bacterium]
MKKNNAKKRVKGLTSKYRSLTVGIGCSVLFSGAYGVELVMPADEEVPKPSASASRDRWELAQFQLPPTP